jgi:hypothetical protein
VTDKPNPAPLAAGRAPDSFESWKAPNDPEIAQSRPLAQALHARKRGRNREAHTQAGIVEWIRFVAPCVLVFAVPNGSLRSKA